MRRSIFSNRGITLIEILIGVVIIGVVASMAVPRFAVAYERMEFNSKVRDVVSALRLARSQAITEKEEFGVYFDVTNLMVIQFQKHDGAGALNDQYESGLDLVLSVDTLGADFNLLSTTLTQHSAVFSPNGASSSGGQVSLNVATPDLVGTADISLLASTGRVKVESVTY